MLDWRFLASRIQFMIRVVCVVLLVANLGLFAAMLATSRGGGTILGTPDYAGFYVAATILNQYPSSRLYDQDLQDTLYHAMLPGAAAGGRYPYGHAPFVAYFLRPLALLPYEWSYPVWLAILTGIGLAGFGVLRRTAGAIPSYEWTTAFLVSVAFVPFTECWLAGQLSIIGFFWIAVALRCMRLGRLFGCGAALAMCLYKPTLLMFALPVLALAGQLRVLAGFTLGALGLAVLSLLTVGPSGCRAYLDMLVLYADTMARGAPGFKVFKHVDINSFCGLWLGGPSPVSRAVILMTASIAVLIMVYTWWARRASGDDHRLLALCATLSWNPVFNLYTPVYDVILVVPNVLITMEALYRRPRGAGHPPGPRFTTILVLLVLGGLVTQRLAESYGFQPLTLVLLILGGYQATLARGHLPEEDLLPSETASPRP